MYNLGHGKQREIIRTDESFVRSMNEKRPANRNFFYAIQHSEKVLISKSGFDASTNNLVPRLNA